MKHHTGWFLFLLLFIAGIFGTISTGVALYVRLAYMGAVLLFSTWLWTRLSLRNVKLKRRARSLRASVGDIFEETFEVENDSLFPRLFVEVKNKTGLQYSSGSRLLTWIGPRESRTYVARTWLTRRGAFPLGPTAVSSGDPFGFFNVSESFPATQSLIVLPMIISIGSFPAPAGFLPGGRAIHSKSMDVTPHASGVREYVSGDAYKRIHWPTSARRGHLMVKEFEQDPQSEFWIYLDAERYIQAELPEEPFLLRDTWIFGRRPEIHLPPSTLEYGISLAASLAHYFIQKQKAVGFVADGSVFTVIPAERSDRQESKILETLAFVKGEGKLPLSSLVDLQSPQMPSGSSAVLITPSTHDEIILAVDLLLRRRLRPIVILLMAYSFGGSGGSENLAERLEHRGVSVCRVYNNSNLVEVLEQFSGLQRELENHSWHELPFKH